MRLFPSLALALVVTVAVTGCRKAKQTPATTVTAGAAPAQSGTRAPTPRAQEPARGEVRAALLQLQRVHFGLDTAKLLPPARDALARAAEGLAAHPDVHVYVEGHTDARGTDEYNVALGESRARAVIDYLVALGIDRGRLHPISLGEERPAMDGDDPRAWAANRRAEFRLMRGDVELVLEAGTKFDDRGTPLADAGRR